MNTKNMFKNMEQKYDALKQKYDALATVDGCTCFLKDMGYHVLSTSEYNEIRILDNQKCIDHLKKQDIMTITKEYLNHYLKFEDEITKLNMCLNDADNEVISLNKKIDKLNKELEQAKKQSQISINPPMSVNPSSKLVININVKEKD